MSHVRMCDRCGLIFKEGIEGSGMGTMGKVTKNEYGRKELVQEAADFCPKCFGGEESNYARFPKAIEGEATQVQ